MARPKNLRPWCKDCGISSDDLSIYKKSYNRLAGELVHTGYCNLCHACNNKRGASSKRKYERKRRTEIRAAISEAKAVPCTDCHVEYPPFVMQFDHLDPAVKLFNIGSFTNQTMDQVRAEIAKCEVVCANCHALRTFTRAGGSLKA
jgi:hypothetical protein